MCSPFVAVLVPARESRFACKKHTRKVGDAMSGIRYVALGDSYTIGTSVSEWERWPNQLVARLRPDIELDLVANLGVNGYTSVDLIDDELPQLVRLFPDFVTLLIGVNDVVQHVPKQVYGANVANILDTLTAAVGSDRVVVVSTPDYTLTPQGGAFGEPQIQSALVARFNELMRARAEARSVRFVSIDAAANAVPSEPQLVARDGLHPSGAQYARWVDLIVPDVLDALATSVKPVAD
jgi:lysophospholipase L1-like esterase